MPAMSTKLLTNNLGYPRIGDRRELKKATEAYWAGKIERSALLAAADELRRRNWKKQRDAGIDLIPSNDFSFYDQVLDMSILLGSVPRALPTSPPITIPTVNSICCSLSPVDTAPTMIVQAVRLAK